MTNTGNEKNSSNEISQKEEARREAIELYQCLALDTDEMKGQPVYLSDGVYLTAEGEFIDSKYS